MSLTLLWVATLLFTSGAVAAQDSLRIAVTAWGAREGLSQSSIHALVQDSSGVLWVGTQGGLNRFDGLAFRLMHADGTEDGLSDEFIQAMALAPDDRLWIGSYQGGLDLFDPVTETVEHYPLTELGPWRGDASPTGPPRTARSVSELVVLGNGAVLALTDVGLAYIGEDATHRTPILAAPPGPAQDSLTALAGCPDGGALVGGSGGEIDRMGPAGAWAESLPPVDSIVQALSCGSPILAGTAGGDVLLLDSSTDEWVRVGRIPQPSSFDLKIRRVLLSDDQLLVGTTEGLFEVDLTTGSGIPFRTGGRGDIPRGEVSVLQKDRHGALWIGTWTGLARRHPLAASVRRILSEESLAGQSVIGIEAQQSTSLLLGLSPGGVRQVRWNDRAPSVLSPAALAPLREARVYGLVPDHEGGFWIAAFLSGIWRWDASGSLRRVPLVDGSGRPAPRSYTRVVLVDQREEVWATVDPLGLMRFDADSHVFRPHLGTELGGTFVWAMAEDPSGRLWVGAYGGGLARIGVDRALERVYTVEGDGLPSDRIMSIFVDTAGQLWIGTEGDGLIRFDPAEGSFSTLTAREGLPSNLVQSVIEDDAGDIWISTGAGLARFTPSSGRIRVLRESAGLAGDQFLANSAIALEDGSLVFGGLYGLSFVDPAAIRKYEPTLSPPSVALTGFSIQGRDTTLAPTAADGGLRLEHDQNFFAFRFTADDYADPSLNRYKYRLTPLQEEWVDAGNEPVANYTSVPPGRYTFEVQAATGFGIWNEAAFTLPVTVVPAFWQTAWFQGLIVLAVLSLVAAFFTYRYRQLEARTRLRLQLAGKLHDDIGADLSSISLKTEIVRSNAALGERTDRLLADAGRLARDTAQKVRETVWMVNTQYDTLPGLVGKMRDTADTMLAEHIPHRFTAPERIPDRPISMEFRQNVHLLYKEALNNARKYSGASSIRIDVEIHGRELTFRVVDEGVGFDPDAVVSGNGQRLMRERAKAARGRVSVASAPGEGTTVAFTGRIH